MEMTEKKPIILVVDDIQDNLDLVVEILAEEPYQVVTAHDAAEALSLAREQSPDVAILDVRMPQMDGFELCRELLDTPVTYRPMIIFLTGECPSDESAIHGLEAGACDYVTKPVAPDVLRARVRAALRTREERQNASDGACRVARRLGRS